LRQLLFLRRAALLLFCISFFPKFLADFLLLKHGREGLLDLHAQLFSRLIEHYKNSPTSRRYGNAGEFSSYSAVPGVS